MTREFLKSLGIADKDVTDRIMAENGRDINTEKARYGDYDSLKTRLAEAEGQLAEFRGMDIDGIRKAAGDYKAKYEQALEDGRKQLDELRFSHTLDGALKAAGARNVRSVKALLETGSLRLEPDGSISGLSGQLEKIRNENDYLFEAENTPDKPRFLGSGGRSSSLCDDAAIHAIMGLSASK